MEEWTRDWEFQEGLGRMVEVCICSEVCYDWLGFWFGFRFRLLGLELMEIDGGF